MLKRLLHSLIDSAKESYGIPVRIHRLADSGVLHVTVTEPKASIKFSDVTNWHEWDGYDFFDTSRRSRGTLLGWKKSGDEYRSFEMHISDMKNLGHCHILENWKCDIQDVVGLAASKSKLEEFATLDEMVSTNSQNMINPISEEKLRENLAWDQIRIINSPKTSDHFAKYLWNGRLFLINAGGSHHFAAARYISAKIGSPVPLTGSLHTYSMNSSAVDALRRNYDIYAITAEAGASNAFHDAMRSFRATYLSCKMPRSFENTRAIFLPRNAQRSTAVSNILRNAGLFDVGKHLSDLVNKQNTINAALR